MDNNVKNVAGNEAAKKIKEMGEAARSCMMLTAFEKRPIPARPMGILKVDDRGRLYFFTDKRSEKHSEIQKSGEMQITIANDKNSEYLNLYGHAELYRDQKEVDELYTAIANTWFDGKEDPNLEIVRFTPEAGHYWDSKAGKLVQMAGLVVGAITGKQTDNGREGEIHL